LKYHRANPSPTIAQFAAAATYFNGTGVRNAERRRGANDARHSGQVRHVVDPGASRVDDDVCSQTVLAGRHLPASGTTRHRVQRGRRQNGAAVTPYPLDVYLVQRGDLDGRATEVHAATENAVNA
jgi:hypothetical protein